MAAAFGAQEVVPLSLEDLQGWDWSKAHGGLICILSSFFPSSADKLHALIDLIPELRDHRRSELPPYTSISLHMSTSIEYDLQRRERIFTVRRFSYQHLGPMRRQITMLGFGLDGSTTLPKETELQAVLNFLNLHPDFVNTYIKTVLDPSDCGGMGPLAILNALWTKPSLPALLAGYNRGFCVGSHRVSFRIHSVNNTPPSIEALTRNIYSGVQSFSIVGNAQRSTLWTGISPYEELVKAMKHWNLPQEIVSAVEEKIPGFNFEFSGSPGGELTCRVYAKSDIDSVITDRTPTEIARANDLFCFFNRQVEGFSAECETMIDMWNASSAKIGIDVLERVWNITLPEFQATLRAVEKQTSAGPLLETREAESLCTVPLKPYQSQSVRFMSDAEQRKLGVQSAFWMELIPGDDESRALTALFSPVTGQVLVGSANSIALGEVNQSKHLLPRDNRGGFLLEAMGLGKTVEMVALMTKNPPPEVLPLRFTVTELAAMPTTVFDGEEFSVEITFLFCHFLQHSNLYILRIFYKI